MNADITLKAKVYKQVYSDQAGSLRRSTTDGAALPHTMRIAHTNAVDSKTKVPTIRSLTRVDMSHLDTGGINPSPLPVSVQLVVVKGTGLYAPTQAAIELCVDTLIQALSGTGADASALDLTDEIFVNGEQ
jgi:hypothetical protein